MSEKKHFSLFRANLFVEICLHLRGYPSTADKEIIAVLESLLAAYRRGDVRRLCPQRERHPADLAFLFAMARNRPDVIDKIMEEYAIFNVCLEPVNSDLLWVKVEALRWLKVRGGVCQKRI